MKRYMIKVLMMLAAVMLASCSKDNQAPVIDSVWKNMISEPIAQTDYAYPRQTLCVRGGGFANLRKVFVNGTEIDLVKSLIYDTDNSITFQLPDDVNTTNGNTNYIRVITARGEDVYRPFLVKPISEKPEITGFSATTLVAGRTLTIKGVNLEGATDVWLPAPFEQQVRCEFDPTTEPTATAVTVIIPQDVKFAQGKCVITMQKTFEGNTYTENVYSSTTNFSN